MKKYLLIFGFIYLLTGEKVFSQDEEYELSGSERIFYGLNISWTNRTESFFELIPNAGYRINPDWMAGIGFKYEYFKTTGSFYGSSVNSSSTNIYGGTLFSSYDFLKNKISKGLSVTAYAEVQALSLSNKFFRDPAGSGRFYYPVYVAGAGLRQKIGRRASFNILLLFAFHKPSPAPFPENPFLRFGFVF